MAAFTTFSNNALERYLIMFGVGDLVSWSPAVEGIENSNYFVTTRKFEEEREFVLTIMESLSFDDLPFFSGVLMHLFHYGMPVPAPQHTLDGMTSTIFCNKPTLLFPKLEGEHPVVVTDKHCRRIGGVLGDIHCALATTDLYRPNPFNIDWMLRTIEQVGDILDENDLFLLNELADEYAEINELNLPRGVTHGDLFRDNALFKGDELTGVIDFYRACNDFLIQDIAITINDWCRTEQDDIDENLAVSLLQGYESVRQLESEEKEFLPCFQRSACARFTLTRLLSGEDGQHLKDPYEYLQLAGRVG
jgi:homoserine kinase type II